MTEDKLLKLAAEITAAAASADKGSIERPIVVSDFLESIFKRLKEINDRIA